jgi:hypothetical protein
MTPERTAELRESAKYSITHGNGVMSVNATELLSLLPPEPVSEPAAVAPAPVAQDVPVPVAQTAEETKADADGASGEKPQIVN